MATFYLCNNVVTGTRRWFAGRLLNDQVDNVIAIRGAGGVLWPSSDPVVAAAAATATYRRTIHGAPPAITAKIMMTAVQNGFANGGTVAGVQKVTATIGFAQLTAAALTMSLPLGALLPANARIISRELRLATPFTGGTIASMACSVGLAGGSEIVTAANVFTGAPGAQRGVDGVDPFELFPTGGQLTVTFTSTVANVNAATAGSLVVDVMYIVAP